MTTTEQNDSTTELTDTEAADVLASMAADGHDTTPEATDAPETDPEPDDEPADDDEPKGRPKAAREAAKYRTQLREVEAERDTLTSRVEALQRQVIDSHIKAAGASPELLWDTGLQAADMLTQDGTVDHQKVQDATRATVQKYGLDTRRPDPAQAIGADHEEQRPPRLFEAHKS